MRPWVGIVVAAGLLAACSKDEPTGAPSPKVNPRLAQSGQQLAEEPDIPLANDSSGSIQPEGKKSAPEKASQPPAPTQTGKGTALTAAQIAELERRAKAGEAAAQLELGNAYFEGNGLRPNRNAAEYWWRRAAQQANAIAADNLRMLFTEPDDSVNFFGTVIDGDRVVYLVDSSGSMGVGDRFKEEKEELIRSIRTLTPDILFTVIFYDDAPRFPQPLKMQPATEANIEAMVKWITAHRLGTENRVLPALRNAITLKPDTVFLLSDGMSDFDPKQICASVRRLNAKAKARIHTISLHDLGGQSLMKQIATENRGQYRYVAPGGKRR